MSYRQLMNWFRDSVKFEELKFLSQGRGFSLHILKVTLDHNFDFWPFFALYLPRHRNLLVVAAVCQSHAKRLVTFVQIFVEKFLTFTFAIKRAF